MKTPFLGLITTTTLSPYDPGHKRWKSEALAKAAVEVPADNADLRNNLPNQREIC
jgi:hypothetical protein